MSTLPNALEQRVEDALSRIARLEQAQAVECSAGGWTYLVQRPHAWRRQLCLKGRNMTAGQVAAVVAANGLSEEQAADDLGLPPEAVREALQYAREQRDLIALEAAEDRRRLLERLR